MAADRSGAGVVDDPWLSAAVPDLGGPRASGRLGVTTEGSIPTRLPRHHGLCACGRCPGGPVRHVWGGRDLRPPACAPEPEGLPDLMNVPTWLWILTIGVTTAILLFDVFIIGRRPHVPSNKETGVRARGLRRAGGPVRPRGLVLRRCRLRHPVLRGLADRVLAVGRQPLRLPHHHGQVRRAGEAPAVGADGRHRHRAGPARHLHRRRCRGDQPVLLGLLPLRRVPDLHGGQAGQRGRQRRRRVRGEPLPEVGRAALPGHQPSGTAPSSS